MADVIDDDTERAVLAAWQADAKGLPAIFKRLPVTGRLKSLDPGTDYAATGPTAQLESKLEARQGAAQGGVYIDRRRVTITVRGIRADVVKAAAALRAVFQIQTGQPKGPPFEFPSGARLMVWEPKGDVEIKPDDASKAGRDVWQAVLSATVWSVRQG